MSYNTIFKGVLKRHATEQARLDALTKRKPDGSVDAAALAMEKSVIKAQRQALAEATPAVEATKVELTHYMDAGTLLRAASKGDTAALEILAIRMKSSMEFCTRMVMCAGDAPSLRNTHTRKLLRIALQRSNGMVIADEPEPEVMRLNSGAPCDLHVLLADDQVKFQLTLDEDDAGQLQFSGFGRKTFDKRYDRHRLFVIVNGKVVEISGNPFACDEHYTHATGDTPGTKNKRMGHKVYPKRFNDNYGAYLADQTTGPIARSLDSIARHLITGSKVTVISHKITEHAKVVAWELARRARDGVPLPTPPPPAPQVSHQNAAYSQWDWRPEREPDTSMFDFPRLDWQRWYWIPVKGGKLYTIAYLLPDNELPPTPGYRLLKAGKPHPSLRKFKAHAKRKGLRPEPALFLYKDGDEWVTTPLGDWHSNEGPRFLPRVFRRHHWAKETVVKLQVIDDATGDLVDVESPQRRSGRLAWNEQYQPLQLNAALTKRFRAGIHQHWLKHPSQSVWRLDWHGREQFLAERAEFKGQSARRPLHYATSIPTKEDGVQFYRGVLEMYIPYAQRRELPLAAKAEVIAATGLPTQRPTQGGDWIDGSSAKGRISMDFPRATPHPYVLHDDEESEYVQRGRIDAHDKQLFQWAEDEMQAAIYAIQGGDSADSMGWTRDGDIDAALAAQLGRDAGAYVAGLRVKETEEGYTQPIVYHTHRQRYDKDGAQALERIFGKTEEQRKAKTLTKWENEKAQILLDRQAGEITNRDIADIAHRKGFRDCIMTKPDGTVRIWMAASQLLDRAPVYVLLAGKQLDEKTQLRLNQKRRFVPYPVRPDTHATQDIRTPDYHQRASTFMRQVRLTFWNRLRQRFLFGVLCLRLSSFRQARSFTPATDAPAAPATPLKPVATNSISAHLNRMLDAIADSIETTWTPTAPNTASPLAPLPAHRAIVTDLGPAWEPAWLTAARNLPERTWREIYAEEQRQRA